MALKLTLRHRLGESRITLDPARNPGHGSTPAIIGRGPAATIEVPSLRVAPRHAAVFVHDGRWVIQDGNTRSGTRVNGQPLPGSRVVYPLNPLDIIELGDDYPPPTLIVEQADLLPAPLTAPRITLPPPAPPAPTLAALAATAPEPPRRPATPLEITNVPAPEPAVETAFKVLPETTPPPAAALAELQTASNASRPVVRRRASRRPDPTAWVFGVFFVLVLLALTAWIWLRFG